MVVLIHFHLKGIKLPVLLPIQAQMEAGAYRPKPADSEAAPEGTHQRMSAEPRKIAGAHQEVEAVYPFFIRPAS